MTYEQLTLGICHTQTATASDFLARALALLESEGGLKMQEALYSLRSCGWLKNDTLKFYSLKTSQDSSTTMGGATFETIIRTMVELGYGVEYQVLNSRDFGVPQNRQRVFIIGHLGGFGGWSVFPFTTHGGSSDELQRQRDQGSIVVNTMVTENRLAHILQTDISQGKWISQAMIAGTKDTIKPKQTDTFCTIQARDYKGVSGYGSNVVIEHEKSCDD